MIDRRAFSPIPHHRSSGASSSVPVSRIMSLEVTRNSDSKVDLNENLGAPVRRSNVE
jgi:hypothetical protein